MRRMACSVLPLAQWNGGLPGSFRSSARLFVLDILKELATLKWHSDRALSADPKMSIVRKDA
ncbi:MAG: hypothetical protein QOD93_2679 [Acetobacteraceae bacterium]|nr:hypothetical protein [Acetobacteraceae bacterium]